MCSLDDQHTCTGSTTTSSSSSAGDNYGHPGVIAGGLFVFIIADITIVMYWPWLIYVYYRLMLL